jgi:hypothetical protein
MEKPNKLINNNPFRVRFQVLTAARKKVTIFWDGASCNLVETGRRLRGVCLDDGGGKQLCNVGQFIGDYTAQPPTRQ